MTNLETCELCGKYILGTQCEECAQEKKPVAEFCHRCEKEETIYDFDGLCKDCLS